jgi:hypothetical protein
VFLLRRQGDGEAARAAFRRALDCEAEAADLIEPDIRREPTRSVLHRSAATLALQCEDWQRAEDLAVTALRGDPPEEIAQELREVLEQAQARQHPRHDGPRERPPEPRRDTT